MSNLLALAAQSVPRYTSYPTASHFTGAVDAQIYASWLCEIPQTATLSLYVHVPFCRQLCLYCGCHTKVVRRREPVDAYARRLKTEIVQVAAQLGHHPIKHLHWGGGTPSLLGAARLTELAELIARSFDGMAFEEHAIELDRQVTPDLVNVLRAIGINRASLGVQDFSPAVQQAIGRIQPYEVVATAASQLRDGGIVHLNLDLMYGLPEQTPAEIAECVALAHSLRPQRIALFGYAHVPWLRPHQRRLDGSTMAGPVERLAQAEAAHGSLTGLGYEPVGLDHFSLPNDDLAVAARAGRLHRNFQGYTTDCADALIGFGASAIGRLPQGYVQNAVDIGGYAGALDSGRLATTRSVALSSDDRLRAQVIERLMCDLEVDLSAVARHHKVTSDFAAERSSLAPLVRRGIVEIDNARLLVTPRGRPFLRLIASVFDTYLGPGHRHAQAV